MRFSTKLPWSPAAGDVDAGDRLQSAEGKRRFRADHYKRGNDLGDGIDTGRVRAARYADPCTSSL